MTIGRTIAMSQRHPKSCFSTGESASRQPYSETYGWNWDLIIHPDVDLKTRPCQGWWAESVLPRVGLPTQICFSLLWENEQKRIYSNSNVFFLRQNVARDVIIKNHLRSCLVSVEVYKTSTRRIHRVGSWVNQAPYMDSCVALNLARSFEPEPSWRPNSMYTLEVQRQFFDLFECFFP